METVLRDLVYQDNVIVIGPIFQSAGNVLAVPRSPAKTQSGEMSTG
jgi:hypothetical protein